MNSFQEIIQFWFSELQPEQHWRKDSVLDQLITERFKELHQRAVQGELFHWRDQALGRLAEIIILDQFSRNIYRDHEQAYAADGIALVLAQEAVLHEADMALPAHQRAFMYMPYMHSESPVIHAQAVQLFDQEGMEANLNAELKHKAIIDRFGRYPHRNHMLGRESTPEELSFLQQPGSSF